MEEKKKIYIRGRKGHGSEIIDIFTRLGATNASEISCENEDTVYFIDPNNKINWAFINSLVGIIIMDNYKEIELPLYSWKEGDILVYNSNPNCHAVFKKYNDCKTFEAYFILYDKAAYFDALAHVEDYRRANKEEIENLPPLFRYLMGKLNEFGLCLSKKVDQK
jgi:hypothetical protein